MNKLEITEEVAQYGMDLMIYHRTEFRKWLAVRDQIIINLQKKAPHKLAEFLKETSNFVLVDIETLELYRDGEINEITVRLEGANGRISASCHFK